jgi:O-methyltransferase involved in polyketide biosynthesis
VKTRILLVNALSDAAALGALLERVGREHDRVFVLTEGLLGYLEEHAVAALASELRSVPAMKLWAAEILSPSLLPHQAALGETFRAAKIEVRFAPTQGVDFFAAYGWRPRRTSPFVDELVRFGRGDGLTLEQRAALRKGSTYVLLESGLSLA